MCAGRLFGGAMLFVGDDWPRIITTSRLSTTPAGRWHVEGCPTGWTGSPVVGLLDGELGRRVCLQAFVRDGRAAADRPAVGAVFKPLESTIEGRESVPQTSGHGVVDALFSPWLRRISHIARLAFGLTVVRLGRVEVGQQLLHPLPLRVQSR